MEENGTTLKKIIKGWMVKHNCNVLYDQQDGCYCSINNLFDSENCFLGTCRPGHKNYLEDGNYTIILWRKSE